MRFDNYNGDDDYAAYKRSRVSLSERLGTPANTYWIVLVLFAVSVLLCVVLYGIAARNPDSGSSNTAVYPARSGNAGSNGSSSLPNNDVFDYWNTHNWGAETGSNGGSSGWGSGSDSGSWDSGSDSGSWGGSPGSGSDSGSW